MLTEKLVIQYRAELSSLRTNELYTERQAEAYPTSIFGKAYQQAIADTLRVRVGHSPRVGL